MWRLLVPATAALAMAGVACCHAPPGPHPATAPAPSAAPAPTPVAAPAPRPPSWPPPLATAMQGRGDPHAQPIPLPRDARGRERWLAFVGSDDVAVGAWRVTLEPGGDPQVEAVEHWPTGVRV